MSSHNIREIANLTPLRGIAALLVCIHNFDAQQFFLNFSFLKYTHFFELGYLWVDFFFLLSGFVMTHVYLREFANGITGRAYKSFMLARFARIYPLHFLTLFALVALEVVKLIGVYQFDISVNQIPFSGDELSTLVSNIFMLQAMNIHDATSWNIPAWSISAEWYSYMLFPILAWLLFSKGTYRLIAVFALATVAVFAFVYFNKGSLAATYDYGFVRCIISFSVGAVIYRFYQQDLLRNILARDGAFIVIAFAVLCLMHMGAGDQYIWLLLVLLLGSGAYNEGRVAQALNMRALSLLGEVSYTIYLLHMVVKTYFLIAWRLIGSGEFSANMTELQSLMVLLVMVGLVALLSVPVYRYFERPSRNYIRRKLGALPTQA